MTHEEFAQFVRKVETTFEDRPEALRCRVFLWALLGYLGLLFGFIVILFVSGVLFAAMRWTEIVSQTVCGVTATLVLVVGSLLCLGGFYVRIPPPEGEELKREKIPKLFAILDHLQAETHSPAFDHVLLVDECNAAVVQVPRLGFLGWSKNYLLIGLPLCEAGSTSELTAVLAHEFAHLSREHGRMGHWLYRLRRSWEEMCRKMDETNPQAFFIGSPARRAFMKWFWPQFNALAFVLSRRNEFEADAQASRLADPRTLATVLVRMRMINHQLNAYTWPAIWRLANSQPKPPENVHEQIAASLRVGPKAEDLERWLREAFRLDTSNTDTHPCLTDRLKALGVPSPWNLPSNALLATPSAAQELFGNCIEELRQRLGARWSESITATWLERHARAGALDLRLTSLNQAVPEHKEDVEALWDRARVLMDLKGDREIESILRQILALRPSHAEANFYLGRSLLEKGESEGERLLTQFMEQEESSVLQVCPLLHDYYRRAGRPEKVREMEARMDHHEKELAASRRERSSISASDDFLPHGLKAEELGPLLTICQAEPTLLRAELVQKRLSHFPKQRLFVLVVHPKPSWHRLPNHDREWSLVNRISPRLTLPGRVVVLPPSGCHRAAVKKASRVPSAQIWRR